MTAIIQVVKKHYQFALTWPGRLTQFALLVCLLLTPAIGVERANGSEWITAAPEDVGVDSTAIIEMFDYIQQHNVPVHSMQLVRDGRLAVDAYFYPYSQKMRHDVASVTKSITSTLIGLAIEKGYIRDVRQPALVFFPDRPITGLDVRKQKMTLEDLLTMQSGWDCGVDLSDPRINVDEQLAAMRRSPDWLQFILSLP